MPCLAEQYILIHSSEMETQVFMPQECSTTSKANPQPGGLQSRTTSLMLLLISVLLLLIVGMVGLYICMHLQPTVEEVNHANCTQRQSSIINFTENNAQNLTSFVFKVLQNGTYFIHGTEKREMNDMTNKSCKDHFYLFIDCLEESKKNCPKMEAFFSNEIFPDPMIVATGVELVENTEVFVYRNCKSVHKREYNFIVLKVA